MTIKAYQMTCAETIAHKILKRFKGQDLEVARAVVQLVLEKNLASWRKVNRKDANGDKGTH